MQLDLRALYDWIEAFVVFAPVVALGVINLLRATGRVRPPRPQLPPLQRISTPGATNFDEQMLNDWIDRNPVRRRVVRKGWAAFILAFLCLGPVVAWQVGDSQTLGNYFGMFLATFLLALVILLAAAPRSRGDAILTGSLLCVVFVLADVRLALGLICLASLMPVLRRLVAWAFAALDAAAEADQRNKRLQRRREARPPLQLATP